MTNFRPGQHVHWIQARKASEDHESWQDGAVDGVEGTVITVILEGSDDPVHFESVDAPLLARSRSDRVWVSQRWSVLAFADQGGDVVGIQPLGKGLNSVFDRAGTQRLRFISIVRAESDE